MLRVTHSSIRAAVTNNAEEKLHFCVSYDIYLLYVSIYWHLIVKIYRNVDTAGQGSTRVKISFIATQQHLTNDA